MGRKTAVILLAFGLLLLAIGGGGLLYPRLRQAATPQKVVLAESQTLRQSIVSNWTPPGTPANESAHPVIPQQDQETVTVELRTGSADDRARAMASIRALADSDGKSLSQGLMSWLGPMLDDKLYVDVEQLTTRAIIARASLPDFVEMAQRARVVAFTGEANYSQALKEAKGYYNVASLSGTGDAVRLLADVLTKTNGPSAAAQFQSEQLFPGSDASTGVALANTDSPPAEAPSGGTVKKLAVDAAAYTQAIADLVKNQNAKGQHSYNRIARGNLLLLSDQPEEARKCFVEACNMAKGDKNVRDAIEGVARAMRARDGNVVQANAYILSLRQDAEKAGADLTPAVKGTPTFDEIRAAARGTAIAEVKVGGAPPLEEKRQEAEAASVSAVQIQISSGFECSTPITVKQLSSTHFDVSIDTPFTDWFMFRVQGMAGKTVRIDLTGDNVEVGKWTTLNPVYSYVTDLDSPASYSATGLPQGQSTTAWNGSVLPSTNGQKWQYISDVWQERPDTLSIVQRFDSDSAFVAMRVPYTPGYNEQHIKGLASNPLVKVVRIGRSVHGRPLQLLEIGGGDESQTGKPCVLIYGGEHADEPDAGWVIQGELEYLLSNDPESVALRDRCIYLMIPVLDPDAATQSIHESIIRTFMAGVSSTEARQYANWFKQWVDAGHRLDVVLDYHNIQSSEGPVLSCALLGPAGNNPDGGSARLHAALVKAFRDRGLVADERPWQRGLSPDRLGGWLAGNYGAATLAYELNSQSPASHLNLVQLKDIGHLSVVTLDKFLLSAGGSQMLTNIDSRRRQRLATLALFGSTPVPRDALTSEAALSQRMEPAAGVH